MPHSCSTCFFFCTSLSISYFLVLPKLLYFFHVSFLSHPSTLFSEVFLLTLILLFTSMYFSPILYFLVYLISISFLFPQKPLSHVIPSPSLYFFLPYFLLCPVVLSLIGFCTETL